MKRVCLVAIMLLFLSALPLAEAQAPTPPNVSTLGPAIICSAGDSATNVKILSPQNNQNYSSNQVQLNFKVQALGMFGQFGNIGYSLDGRVIKSVNDFVNKTVDHPTDAPDWYWNRTTVFASILLPNLAESVHNVTVYYGWQYLGTNNPSLERFEVFAYDSASFTVINTADASPYPSASPSPFPSPTSNSTVTLPTTTPTTLPTPSTIPSSSPTLSPTQIASVTPFVDAFPPDNSGLYIFSVIIGIAVIMVGLALYFKKKREGLLRKDYLNQL